MWWYRGHIEGGLRSCRVKGYQLRVVRDACPFRPTVATINLTIVKGRLIHATLLSIRYSLSRKRMDFCDFHLDHSQYILLYTIRAM